jgi:hypothetical protein
MTAMARLHAFARGVRALAIVTVLAWSACTAKFGGQIQIDGAAFVAKTCRSGQALGFSGVELASDTTRVRLLTQADGTAVVGLFEAAAARGVGLGRCATLTMRAQSSRINSIQNMSGEARFACREHGRTVDGTISFENCH